MKNKNEDILDADENAFDYTNSKDIKKVLQENGITINSLIKSLKGVIDGTGDGRVKLAAIQQLLAIAGINKKGSKDDDGADSDWEATLMRNYEKERKKKAQEEEDKRISEIINGTVKNSGSDGQVIYDIPIPQMPEDLARRKAEEAETGASFHYDVRTGNIVEGKI